jgi:hypothetical protein
MVLQLPEWDGPSIVEYLVVLVVVGGLLALGYFLGYSDAMHAKQERR